MNPKDYIIDSLRKYPGIFSNPTSALHHALCVNGNGMEWRNGEICEFNPFEDRGEKAIAIEDAFYKESENFIKSVKFYKDSRKLIEDKFKDLDYSEGVLEGIIESDLKKHYERLLTINRSREISSNPLSHEDIKEVYPLCEYSKICCIPKDITPEWAKVIKDFYLLVLLPKQDSMEEESKKWVDKIRPKIDSL